MPVDFPHDYAERAVRRPLVKLAREITVKAGATGLIVGVGLTTGIAFYFSPSKTELFDRGVAAQQRYDREIRNGMSEADAAFNLCIGRRAITGADSDCYTADSPTP